MREMTASEVSRNFSAVLDTAAAGETIVVTRGGRRTATIGPAPAATGAALNAVLNRWRGTAAVDEAFAERVEASAAAASTDRDADPWND